MNLEPTIRREAKFEDALIRIKNNQEALTAICQNFRKLEFDGDFIDDINGISYFENLLSLIIPDGDFQLGPIANLKKLKILVLANHRNLKDASPLSKLKNLEHLDISASQVSDLKFVTTMESLKEISLSDCKNITSIKQLKPLLSLDELKLINLKDSSLERKIIKDRDSFIIKKLKAQNVIINVRRHNYHPKYYKVYQYNTLKNQNIYFKKWAELFDYTQIANKSDNVEIGNQILTESMKFFLYSFIKNLNLTHKKIMKITRLNLDLSKITEFKGLENFVNLEYLSAGLNPANNAEQISSLTNLKYLSLEYMYFDDWSFLQELKKLKELALYMSNIDNLEFLKDSKLEQLSIAGCKEIKDPADLKPLLEIDTLKKVELSNTPLIKSIVPPKKDNPIIKKLRDKGVKIAPIDCVNIKTIQYRDF